MENTTSHRGKERPHHTHTLTHTSYEWLCGVVRRGVSMVMLRVACVCVAGVCHTPTASSVCYKRSGESTQAFLTPTEWAHALTYTRTAITLTQIPRHKGENRGETASMNSSTLLQTEVHLALMLLNPIINADHQIPQSHRKRKIVCVRERIHSSTQDQWL